MISGRTAEETGGDPRGQLGAGGQLFRTSLGCAVSAALAEGR